MRRAKRFIRRAKNVHEIKDRIKKELGFTVNIGVSTNKLLAKMAGELKKPDMVHTIFPEEIPTKMWPLPIEELFMVGIATSKKLRSKEKNGSAAIYRSAFLDSGLHSITGGRGKRRLSDDD